MRSVPGFAAQRELETQYSRQNVIVTDLKKNGSALKSHLCGQAEGGQRAQQPYSRPHCRRAAQGRGGSSRSARGGTPARGAASGAACTRRGSEGAGCRERGDGESESVTADNSTKKKAEPARKRKEKPRKDNDAVNKQKKTVKNSDAEQSKNYADARKRRPRGAGSSSGSAASTASSNAPNRSHGAGGFEKMRGALPRPVSGPFKVTSRFGRHSFCRSFQM